jgi:hypothetical protein
MALRCHWSPVAQQKSAVVSSGSAASPPIKLSSQRSGGSEHRLGRRRRRRCWCRPSLGPRIASAYHSCCRRRRVQSEGDGLANARSACPSDVLRQLITRIHGQVVAPTVTWPTPANSTSGRLWNRAPDFDRSRGTSRVCCGLYADRY